MDGCHRSCSRHWAFQPVRLFFLITKSIRLQAVPESKPEVLTYQQNKVGEIDVLVLV